MDERSTYLVTGATSGIGESIAAQLAAAGVRVMLGARSVELGDTAAARIRHTVPEARLEVIAGDLSSLDHVRSVADQVIGRCQHLDAVILNAGVVRPRRELTADGIEVDFATNHLSQFLLIQLLTELLLASGSARVVSVTSSAHRQPKTVDLRALVTGENFHHMHTSTATKLLNVLFITELARRLAGSGVTANAADPGFVRTRLGRDAPGLFDAFLTVVRPFQLSPTKAAATPVYVATSTEADGITGAYFAKCRRSNPGQMGQHQPTAERLWSLSEELTANR